MTLAKKFSLYDDDILFLFFFFFCCFRFLPMYSTISVRKQWYEGASGKCISFTQANSDGGDDKTTKCTKEFPYFPFVFIFFVYVSVRVGVCVCGDSGVALWYNSLRCHNNLQRNDICKVTRQNSLKMMHKHVFSLSSTFKTRELLTWE